MKSPSGSPQVLDDVDDVDDDRQIEAIFAGHVAQFADLRGGMGDILSLVLWLVLKQDKRAAA